MVPGEAGDIEKMQSKCKDEIGDGAEGGKERGVNGDERRICINTPCAFVGAISVNSF